MIKFLSPMNISSALIFCVYFFHLSSGFASENAGLCYQSSRENLQLADLNSKDSFVRAKTASSSKLSKAERHFLALQASSLVYSIPSSDLSGDVKLNVKQFQNLFNSTPAGYQIKDIFTNVESGLKFIVLKPIDTSWPWVMAFAGTESTIDFFSDISRGITQSRSSSLEIEKYFDRNCKLDEGETEVYAAHEWILAGHSLGGGIAQYIALQNQYYRYIYKLLPIDFEVVTFNSFGIADQLANLGLSNLEELKKTIEVSNYFVEGELVSRIGHHLGKTYEMALPIKTNIKSVHTQIDDIKYRHSINTVMNLTKNSASFFEQNLKEKTPSKLLMISFISKWTFLFGNIDRYRFPSLKDLSFQIDNLEQLIHEIDNQSLNDQIVISYVSKQILYLSYMGTSSYLTEQMDVFTYGPLLNRIDSMKQFLTSRYPNVKISPTYRTCLLEREVRSKPSLRELALKLYSCKYKQQ